MRLAFWRSYVVLVFTQRCARTSRMAWAAASKRSRALAALGSMARSKIRCRSYSASWVPENGILSVPYCCRSCVMFGGFPVKGTTFAESGREMLFVLIRGSSYIVDAARLLFYREEMRIRDES